MDKKHYVTVFETGQCYGGPEEGGWWFTAGTPVEVFGPFTDEKSARACRDDLYQRIEDYKSGEYHMGHGSHDGVDDAGEGNDAFLLRGGQWGESDITIGVDTLPGKSFPEERPHYE